VILRVFYWNDLKIIFYKSIIKPIAINIKLEKVAIASILLWAIEMSLIFPHTPLERAKINLG